MNFIISIRGWNYLDRKEPHQYGKFLDANLFDIYTLFMIH